MKTCKYTYKNEDEKYKCEEEVWQDSDYCILHSDFPYDKNSHDFNVLSKAKDKKVKEKIENEDFNFTGAKLIEINLRDTKIDGDISFNGAKIDRDANFRHAKIDGDISFNDTEIDRDISFNGAKIDGNANFNGAKIGGGTYFASTEISGDISFNGAKIGGYTYFDGAKIDGSTYFDDTKIDGDTFFINTKVGENVSFEDMETGGDANFNDTEVDGGIYFDSAKIGGDANFNDTKIDGGIYFDNAKIGRDANFNGAKIGEDASFNGAKIDGDANFWRAKIGWGINFIDIKVGRRLNLENAKFGEPNSEEEICRMAKTMHDSKGDKIKADYYFYREMVAKRKQKFYMRYFELPIQYCFGYGVYPQRIIFTWLTVVFIIAFIFWLGNGVQGANTLLANLYFSAVTALTPGYGGYTPTGNYQLLATVEAVFGTFMWAAFIATFSRKFMR